MIDNLNNSISENGKVDLEHFITLTNKTYETINYSFCCKSDSEQLFALLRYAMPDIFTNNALKNIVKGFEEQSK